MRTRLLLTGIFPVLLSGACSLGALKQADYTVECRALDGGCPAKPFLEPLAVGGRVSLDVALKQVEASTLIPAHLRAVDPGVLSIDGRDVHGAAAGLSSLLLVSPDDVVFDMFHVWVGEASHLRLAQLDAVGSQVRFLDERLRVATGTGMLLRVVPFAQTQSLDGEFDLGWDAQPAGIVTVSETEVKDVLSVVADAAGTATLTVNALGRTIAIDLEVTP